VVKLNLGSKDRKLAGFDNLDKIFGWLFQDGLPQYGDSTVDGITISHALTFLTLPELEKFSKEMWRVLKDGGIVRITEDDTENPLSDTFQTGNVGTKPSCLTGPKMMRAVLESAGFKVYDVDLNTTHFVDKTLMQAYRGGAPNRYFIEGVKNPQEPNNLTTDKTGSLALLEGIKKQGGKFEISNCARADLPDFFVQMGYKVGAEVGVYKGAFTEKFCKAGLKMFAIDPWMAYQGAGRTQQEQARQNFLYEHTIRTLSLYPDCTLIRSTSMDALKYFEDGSLDFVYLDGDHSFRAFAADIVEWSKKVKPGGIVSGHDYFYFGPRQTNLICQVGPIVDAYVKAFEIETLYIFGKIKDAPDKDDRYPSWMYIKK
jgi:hypothetical protein